MSLTVWEEERCLLCVCPWR